MTATDERRMMDTKQAAQYLGLSAATLSTDRCTRRLGIPHLKLGKRVLYRAADLDQWIEARFVRGSL